MTQAASQEPSVSGVHELTHWGVLAVRGQDSGAFLHRQFSTSMLTMQPGDARLSSWSDARGRLLAVFRILATPAEWLLLMPPDRVEAMQQGIARYILRDDVQFHDASAQWRLLGLHDASPPSVGYTVPLDTGPRRMLCCLPAEQLETARDQLLDTGAQLRDTEAWRLLDIRAGLPQIHAATAARFTAQMVNLDLLDAIDFDKGCYPGQEVIARAHYLGRSKRRMFVLRSTDNEAVPEPGDRLYPTDAGDPEPVGEIVEAAHDDLGGWQATAVLRLTAAESPLVLGHANGRPVHIEPPPYPLQAA